MKAEDFIRVRHVSCNGCHFQLSHRVTCMDDSNTHLINSIFLTLGNCFGAYPYIFRLKCDAEKNIEKIRAKPKANKSFVETLSYHQKPYPFQEKDSARY
jgi:hypothetical protein